MDLFVSSVSIQDASRARLGHLDETARQALPRAFSAFLDAAVTATSRATFYNSKEEQEAVLERVHEALFAIDRGIYATALLLPGLSDHSRQQGIRRLLSHPHEGRGLLSPRDEKQAIDLLLGELPPQRRFKLFDRIRAARVNNARTRKLILQAILSGEGLEFWAVKYRRKLARALQHAWGKKTASIVKTILGKGKGARTSLEQAILDRSIGRFAGQDGRREVAEECVQFILGNEENLTLPRLCSYHEAKGDLQRGELLPYEVLEGIRSRFHKDAKSADVLELTKKQLTSGQKIALQRTAEEAGVEIALDLDDYDAVRLYLHAFEMGMTDEIRRALSRKSLQGAAGLPLRFQRIAVLLDASASMAGHETQKLRPIAVALALRDLFCAAAEEAAVVAGDGRPAPCHELLEPRGDTSLAAGLVACLGRSPEVVFIVTDGYENAPAGRTGEVIHAARRLGVKTPIYQLSPVFAAESGAVRLVSEMVPTMPVSHAEALGLGLLKAAFEIDVERGVSALLAMTVGAIDAPADNQGKMESSDDSHEQE